MYSFIRTSDFKEFELWLIINRTLLWVCVDANIFIVIVFILGVSKPLLQ